MSGQSENQQGDGSHIDNIIGRLREVRDGGNVSQERSRDVVERSDGTRVVRVRRRRRVYQDDKKDMEAPSADFKKWILMMGAGAVIVGIAVIAFLMVRISSFNSEEFVKAKTEELSKAWNAQVEIKGVSFEGLSFSVQQVKAQFSEPSLIKEVTFRQISGDLIPVSFLTGICQGDTMKVSSARVVLRNDVKRVNFPSYTGKKMWNYSRYRVEKFDVEFEDVKNAPFQLSSELYVRRSDQGERYNCNLNSKTLVVKGWLPISLNVASIYLTDKGLEYIDINGSISDTATVSITGELQEGADLYAPSLTLTGVNIPLASITNGRFTPFVSAELGSPSETDEKNTEFKFSLPSQNQEFPPFKGSTKEMKKLSFRGLPILKELSDLTGNKGYLSPVMPLGNADISSDGNDLSISQIDAIQYSFLAIRGAIKIASDKDLSGRLSIGVPSRSAMGTDMIIDPLFVRDDGEMVWVDVSLSGTLDKPMDNTGRLTNSVKAARAKISRERAMLLNPGIKSSGDSNSGDGESEDSEDEQEFKSLLR